MGMFATAKRFGTRSLGGLVACFLFLPLPALAYTFVSSGGNFWTFSDNGQGVSLSQAAGGDPHKLVYSGSSGTNSNAFAQGSAIVNSTSAGELLHATLDMTGLVFDPSNTGTLTVKIALQNGHNQSVVFNNSNAPYDFTFGNGGQLGLSSGNQTLTISFSYSNATFSYSSSTAQNVIFY
jgi:hypothetical protein